MVAKEEVLVLKTKLLPSGAEAILDILASRHEQLEFTNIVLENVPLLIIGRHGMIARIPVNGQLQKVSRPDEILQTLHKFFQRTDSLYVFINLPELAIPPEVTALLNEVGYRAERRSQIQQRIDASLDARDQMTFEQAVKELAVLDSEHQMGT
jgi:hypothetical protein